ncbi:putative TOS1-like glycosyl hydrolase-domain-containing protein [Achaetomium macrosporum]|uniref:glucan endo-1,3-beta-D-glucosidase n=1 Tax=Achaetomium macrosporum TaxID=79813 RepID=A0AAN7C459_9PEZI|nr:putative TOS1-like glycosyl hydrolase-domain-containing protein [Achaetomium macrosporum]
MKRHTHKQLCQGTSHEENGNWYCRQVQRITYENIGASGQYNEVVSMDQQTGDCEFAVRNVSGPLAPFNEPLSLHFRGPLNLKQVAVYMLDSSTSGHKQQQENTGTSTPAQFVRTGYYNAAQQKAEGVVFLGNYGGQGSGKWTPKFGNTLSYLKADGTGGASEPTLLKDTTISSSHEVALLTNETCDASCGYVQPGSVAYKGFPGPSRIFLLELSMPHFITTTTPFPSNQADAPAIWLLNARIPYTGQYSCNCWASGCGEIDVLEVLAAGGDKAVSTVHHGSGNRADSDPNYFARPVDVDQPVRVAVVFDAVQGEVSVQVLGQGRGEYEHSKGNR